ncbi:MAG: hypothetical protein IJB25_09190 [Clostridia bacterium]|nr:hypothetical protein [Clostridia bacterium]MBQ4620030.1 hypothetical protein [Clostridia bacterium]MBQ9855990.1 hypothetical protein [Clostridia bacterium]
MGIIRALAGACPILGKILGGLLILAGLIVILISVPGWFWTVFIGILLIVAGFLIWRYFG